MELAEREGFPESIRAREKPFRMYKDNRMMTVKLTNLEEGWNFDNTDDTQVNLAFIKKENQNQARKRSFPSVLSYNTRCSHTH